MKKLHAILLLVSFACLLKAQLSGSAFLNGQTNHAGIRVICFAASGTAITDSTTTDAAGNFTLNISGGLYNVTFYKTGYQTVYYSNGASVVLTNTTVLTGVTLLPGNIINVSGNVSGTWSNTNIYVVTGDINVPGNSALTIQPGTEVRFNGNYTLTVNGILNAIGSPSSKIVFTSNFSNPQAGNWYGIILNSNQGLIKNCLIEYCLIGIWVIQCSPPIEDNEIRRFGGSAIELENSSSVVRNNTIHDYFTNPYGFGIAIDNCNASIDCNTIYDGTGRGISVGDASSVKNNNIYNIKGTTRGYGIDPYYICTSRIENNIIHDCNIGITTGENISPGPDPTIVNNTIYNNVYAGIQLRGIFGHGRIINNVIVGNKEGIVQANYGTCVPYLVTHNLVWNNFNGIYDYNYDYVMINAIGQIVNTNSNGDPIDSYFNLSQDPLFVNNTPPFLSSNSPCLHAGDSNYSSNIGCDASQMCAGMVLGMTPVSKVTTLQAYPNPFSSRINISHSKIMQVVSAVFYDVTGKSYPAVSIQNTSNSVTLVNEDLVPGIYFLELSYKDGVSEYIRVIKQ